MIIVHADKISPISQPWLEQGTSLVTNLRAFMFVVDKLGLKTYHIGLRTVRITVTAVQFTVLYGPTLNL